MRTTLLLPALITFAPLAGAQVDVDAQPEGATFTTIALAGFHGIATLRDLDRGQGTAPDAFVVDDASGTLRFERGFTAPNLLNFGPSTAGPVVVLGRCKSFAIDIAGTTNRMNLYLWVSRAEAGNTLHFEMLNGTTPIQVFDAPIPLGTAVHRLSVPLYSGTLAMFDGVRVTCAGPHDGGAFHGAIDRLDFSAVGDSVPSPYCGEFSGGGNTPCPCGNSGPPRDAEGCTSSFGFGARMRGAGTASVANDTFELLCQQVPNSAAILVQGSPFVQIGTVFGDGVSCLGGNLVRITTRPVIGGELHYPDAGEPPLSAFVGTATGVTYGYQVVYRNAASFCTSATFNVSDTQPVTWSP